MANGSASAQFGMTHQLGVALVGEELDHGGLRANMCMCVFFFFPPGKGPKQVVSLWFPLKATQQGSGHVTNLSDGHGWVSCRRLRTFDGGFYGAASDADLLKGRWYDLGRGRGPSYSKCPKID